MEHSPVKSEPPETAASRSGAARGDPLARDPEAFQAMVRLRMEALQARLGEVFFQRGPVVLEFGSGHGHFLTSYATAHPGHLCVGIDIMSDRVRRAVRKQERAGLENLLFLRAEGREFLACLPAGARFQRVFVLFPDPWPKKRHHKNRLLSAPFFDDLARWSAPGAQLFFRTDFAPYFNEVRESLRAHPLWKLEEGAEWPFDEPTVFQQRAEGFSSLVAHRD